MDAKKPAKNMGYKKRDNKADTKKHEGTVNFDHKPVEKKKKGNFNNDKADFKNK